MQLTIIDTKAGNFGSILNGFQKIGADIVLTDDYEAVKNASALVIPGVSAFTRGMKGLNDAGLVDLLKQRVIQDNIPTIGICLGMQLLAKTGLEGSDKKIEGLGIIDAEVVKLSSTSTDYRVPNIGWYDVKRNRNSVLFPDNYEQDSFYHVHSYHMVCNDKSDIAAAINYDGQDITVSIERENVFGCQFHPEKSQDAGLDLLDRFVKEAKSA
jgi:glutamine amidotransferase